MSPQKQFGLIGSWTQDRLWVSGNRMLARDPLGAVGCRVGPLWLWPVMAHPADAQSECDLGILEAGPCSSNPSGAFLQCGWEHCPSV